MTRALLLAALLAGCTPAGEDGPACEGGKCDVPDDPADHLCSVRRADAFNANQAAYLRNALRWSCADALGVTAEDRGQEYCEYFAIVQPPNAAEPLVVGRNLGDDSSQGTTEPSVELDAAQIAALEADESAVVGQCIFTSWNNDKPGAAPICNPSCPEVFGVPLKVETFRMKFEVNSAEAAQLLVEDCYTEPQNGDADEARDPLHDEFTRGCMLNDTINETSYRKSDTTVCAASMRLWECGCTVEGKGGATAFAEALAPLDRRGFPLGTWSGPSQLPPGCQYVDLGDGSRTVVACDLTAADLLASTADPKGHCREKYAANVVVHVPVPADVITCSPPPGGQYANSCTGQPWVVQP